MLRCRSTRPHLGHDLMHDRVTDERDVVVCDSWCVFDSERVKCSRETMGRG